MKNFVPVFLLVCFISTFSICSVGRASESEEILWIKIEKNLQQNNSDLNDSALDAIKILRGRGNAETQNSEVIDALIRTDASCLDDQANWINREKGKNVYDLLKSYNNDQLIDSLARLVLKSTNRLHILFLGVKLGIQGSEERLNSILMNNGDVRMAEDFLNSGSQSLYNGGKQWGNAHGYHIMQGMGSHRVVWGRF